MALAATTIWELRTTGNDANGGGFDPALSGTDYSLQDSAQATYSDISVSGISAPSAPTVNSGNGTLTLGVYKVKITYLTAAAEETTPSSESSITVTSTSNDAIVVTSPGAATDATKYRVYATIHDGSTFYLCNGAGTNLGTNYTISTNPNTNNAQPPATNNTGLYLSSSARNFLDADKGNNLQFSADAKVVQIKSITTGVAKIDRGITTPASGLGGKLGGCMATPGKIGGYAINGNRVHCAGGTYTTNVDSLNVSNGKISTTGVSWIGYQTTRQDLGDPPVFVNTVNNAVLMAVAGTAIHVHNFKFVGTGNNTLGGTGLSVSATQSLIHKITATALVKCIYNTGNQNCYVDLRFEGDMTKDGLDNIINYTVDGLYNAGGTDIQVSLVVGYDMFGEFLTPWGDRGLYVLCFSRNCGQNGAVRSDIGNNRNVFINCSFLGDFQNLCSTASGMVLDGDSILVMNCLIAGYGTYGIEHITTSAINSTFRNISTFNTPTGVYSLAGTPLGLKDFAEIADPFVSDETANYNLVADSAVARAGIPTHLDAAFATNLNIGAVQEPTGGTTSKKHRGHFNQGL